MIDINRIRRLLAQAPQPPEERLPGGISDTECDAFEQRTGIRLPEEVRQWLKISNGPCVGPGGLYGIRPQRSHLDIEAILDLYPSWKTRQWIPIAGDGCGNYYVIPTQEEYGSGYPVLFVDTNSTSDVPAYIVASDIGHFLVSLLEKELGEKRWPFDENYVTKADPEITRFVGVPLPWMVD
jgi:cell wall assembly regulator SMI1